MLNLVVGKVIARF